MVMKTLSERCKAIEMLVVDVDGVLTDGAIIYGNDDMELKAFHVRDGSGLKIWRGLGKRAALITGRTSRVVERRAAELDLSPVVQGASEKIAAYRQILSTTGLHPDQVGVIGDDLPDLPVLRNCGLAIAVADACPEVIADAHYVTHAAGGRGAVREAIELILRCQGHWQYVVERFRNEKLSDG
jgi:3-deoxy-D-manno-octulosonate 8-phosphate phosphatase (KDO 8-P phosphatase)